MSISSNTTQRLLSQANNISYGVRDSYRMGTVPENRKADYMFRHFYMVPVCAILTELGFRIAEKYYTMPQMTRVLGLKNLEGRYGNASQDLVGAFKHLKPEDFPKFKSLDEIPFLKARLTGSLARESSTALIPDLIRDVDLPKVGTDAAQKNEVLLHHLSRLMNFETRGGFLDSLVGKQLTADDVTLVKEGIAKLQPLLDNVEHLERKLSGYGQYGVHMLSEKEVGLVKSALSNLEKYSPEALSALTPLQAKLAKAKGPAGVAGADLKVLTEGLQALKKGNVIEKMATGASDLVKSLIGEGAANRLLVAELKAIQKTSFWPKMIVTTGLNFVLYGVLQSWLDVNIIQPWQKKLFEKRGTTNEVVTPVYWGLIPFVVTLGGLMSDRVAPGFVKKMGHVGRFLTAGTLALGAYTATAAGLSAYRLSKPPKNAPQQQEYPFENGLPPAFVGGLAGSQLNHPRGFKGFELNRFS